MANRTVTVKLQAEVAGYVSGLKTAGQATEKLNDQLDDVGNHDRDFAEAEKSAAGLTAGLKPATAAADKLGDELRGTGADAKFMSAELAKAKRETLELAAAFAVTGDAATLTKYKKSKAYVSDLERLAKDLGGGAGEAGKAAEKAGAQAGQAMAKSASGAFTDGLGGLFTNPYVLAALIPAVVELGAGVGGALLLGIGLAGIGAGIAGQIHSPLVERAALSLSKTVGAGFAKATEPFALPLSRVLQAAQAEWIHLSLGLQLTFKELAPYVTALGAGFLGFIDKVIPGLERAAVAARPLLDTFSNWLPQFGGELASLFETMADNADALNDGLGLVLGTISVLVKTVDYGVTVGSKLFEVAKATTGTVAAVSELGKGSQTASLDVSVMAAKTAEAAAAAKSATPDFAALNQTLNQTAATANTVAGAMTDKVINTYLAADEAALGLARSQKQLADTLRQNGHAFNINSEAGQANRQAILSSIRANLQFYDTMIESGYSAKEAAAAYDKNTAALEAQLKKAHFTKDQIQQLIGEYKNVPDKVNTAIAVEGLTKAINDLNDLLRKLNGLPPLTTVTVETIHIDKRTPTYYAKGGYLDGRTHAASGMYLGASNPGTVIAAEPETGGEWLIPRRGISQQRAGMLLGDAAAAHGLSLARSVPAFNGGWGGAATTTPAVNNSVNLTVLSPNARMTNGELQAWQRAAETHQRVGRPR
jgi:hypothetical protein